MLGHAGARQNSGQGHRLVPQRLGNALARRGSVLTLLLELTGKLVKLVVGV